MEFSLTPAPYMRSKRTTQNIMREFMIGLLVVFLSAVIFYFVTAGVNYGFKAIGMGVSAILTAVISEALYFLPSIIKEKQSFGKSLLNLLKKLRDSFGYVTGLIMALLLPIGTPIYVVIVSTFVGVFFAKMLFGGFGYNIFNPAIAGRIVAQLAFGSSLTTTLGSDIAFDIASGATVPGAFQSQGWFFSNFQDRFSFGLADAVLGNYRGTLGETMAIVIIIVGVVLAIRKVIDYKVPLIYLGTMFLACFALGFVRHMGIHSFEFAAMQVLIGGGLFGAVFCLTDPVTSPTSNFGRVIFALGSVMISLLIRFKGAAPEGVAYSILIMNILSPVIDKLCKGRTSNNLRFQWMSVASGFIIVLSMVSLVGWNMAKPGPINQYKIQTLRLSDKEYNLQISDPTGDHYNTIDLKVFVDANKEVVTDIKVISHTGTPGNEYGPYGKDLLEGNMEALNQSSSALHFYETYIKGNQEIKFSMFMKYDLRPTASYTTVNEDGKSVTFDNLDALGTELQVGATYTAKSYMAAMNYLVKGISEGVIK